jgi:hypothetical protein
MYPVAAVPNTPAKTPAVLERPSSTPCKTGEVHHCLVACPYDFKEHLTLLFTERLCYKEIITAYLGPIS